MKSWYIYTVVLANMTRNLGSISTTHEQHLSTASLLLSTQSLSSSFSLELPTTSFLCFFLFNSLPYHGFISYHTPFIPPLNNLFFAFKFNLNTKKEQLPLFLSESVWKLSKSLSTVRPPFPSSIPPFLHPSIPLSSSSRTSTCPPPIQLPLLQPPANSKTFYSLPLKCECVWKRVMKPQHCSFLEGTKHSRRGFAWVWLQAFLCVCMFVCVSVSVCECAKNKRKNQNNHHNPFGVCPVMVLICFVLIWKKISLPPSVFLIS